ncbi:unnamed protein product, partial [Amaranthus hypochondriacus]
MASFTSSSSPSNLFPPPSPSPLLHSTFRNQEFRLWKKRRLKRKHKFLSLFNNLQPPSSAPLDSPLDFLSILPLDWVPSAALGFTSALTLTFLNRKSHTPQLNSNSRVSDIGEWILFSSPTPFNRFVLLRCPSISFEYLEDVSERLTTEEKHYVRLDSGRIQLRNGDEDEVKERDYELFEYQRVCVGTDDGGVISLDWPSNLDLSEERGLDTTVLLVPGTAEGSMDEDIRSFVRDCLRRGLFPIVMNPRGCAGSPLTTARLFTAADSDDICSAVQFITSARPWSTLTAVGWGYGANMLTKYLAEAGEKTPLTAATCIDNPFDLDEATRTSPYCTTIDDKLTGGLIDILKSNKELFQGRRKGFDVEKALAAESVRDFEKVISTVSYGFDTVEEFYTNSSTRLLVGNLKIPVLFVQNDNGTVPLFSIPRGSIAENPFTSLLLCSCLPSNVTASSWYQQVAIEWLAAVELGLLKGRHPLLQDIDVTINPSKGLALVEGRTSETNGRLDEVLNIANLNDSDTNMDPMKEFLTENDPVASIQLKFNQNLTRNGTLGDQILSGSNGAFPRDSLKNGDSSEDTEPDLEETDQGQVLQTAQVVMNMLDVTMPGTLKEEDKKKVLSAIGQGETLIKALEDAVPEDVRGKLTTSVSEILQAQGKNLNFDSLLSIKHKAKTSAGSKSKNDNTSMHSTSNANNDHLSDNIVASDSKTDSSDNSPRDVEKLDGEVTGAQPEKPLVRSDISDSKELESQDDHKNLTKNLSETLISDENLDADGSRKVGQISESVEDSKVNSSSHISHGTHSEAGVMQSDKSLNDDTSQKESNIFGDVGEPKDSTSVQNNTSSAAESRPAGTNEAAPASVSENQLSEKADDGSKTKSENLQPKPDQTTVPDYKSPTFSVSQALDALTGLDDSTQVAVNSVFGVLEDMIAHLEEKNNDSLVNKESEEKNPISSSVNGKDGYSGELQLEKRTEGENTEDTIPLVMKRVNGHDRNKSMKNSPTAASDREDNIRDLNLVIKNSSAAAFDKLNNFNKYSFYITSDPYLNVLYREVLRKYVLPEMQKVKRMDRDSTDAPFLDNVPEDGHWVLIKQPDGMHVAVFDNH